MVNRKHVFWQALLSAVLIFGVGLLIGVAFEDARNKSVEEVLLRSEINVLDSQLSGDFLGNFGIGCEFSRGNIIGFADEIYFEAQKLEDYDDSSQLTSVLDVLHRKYDLLRVMLWMQSIELKKNCGDDFHTLVYIYQYKTEDLEVKSKQVVFSRLLEGMKEKYGNQIILIPIAGDLDLNSVELIKGEYRINKAIPKKFKTLGLKLSSENLIISVPAYNDNLVDK